MGDFVYAKRDFENWIKNLDYETKEGRNSLDDYQKTIINLLYENFDEIASADGWSDGRKVMCSKREEIIFKKIQESYPDKLNTERPEFYEEVNIAQPIRYLTSLEVRNFRGFKNTQLFEFKNTPKDLNEKNRKPTRYNLFYGPNGSGKTSFCEALEYSILGSIEDAQFKGFDTEEYIVHGSEENSVKSDAIEDKRQKNSNHCFIKLMGTNSLSDDGRIEKEIEIKTNKTYQEKYRFAFIERRRIDGFSHIGSRKTDELERIATLFGHGQFFEFINELTRVGFSLYHRRFLTNSELSERENHNQDTRNDFLENMFRAFRRICTKLEMHITSILETTDADLLENACCYYNAMNNDDSDREELLNIKFEKSRRRPIHYMRSTNLYVKITHKNGANGNALRLLSEGHIKLLGLALLLAKAVKDNVPFIIFDDIVNAIDDDHRAGVAEFLLNDKDVSEKQLFLTCHGDVFLEQIKKYAMGLKKKSPKVAISSYTFLGSYAKKFDGIIAQRDDEKAETKINLAQEYLNWGRKRDCTAACRQALELITDRLWNGIGAGHPLNIQLKNRNDRPDLRNVTNQIKSKIENELKNNSSHISNTVVNEHLSKIHSSLKDILEKDGWWDLLNKGIHEDSMTKEFATTQTQKIVNALRGLSESTVVFLNELKSRSSRTNAPSEKNQLNNDVSINLDYARIQRSIEDILRIVGNYKNLLKSTCETEQKIKDIISDLNEIANLECKSIITPTASSKK